MKIRGFPAPFLMTEGVGCWISGLSGGLLQIDPEKRLSPERALRHPFLHKAPLGRRGAQPVVLKWNVFYKVVENHRKMVI